MTYKETHYAAMIRMPLIAPHMLVPLMKPMEIIGLHTTYRSVEDSIRRGDRYYHEVVLADPNGRSQIVAGLNQVEPYDREQFDAMWQKYNETMTQMRAGDGYAV